MPLDGAACRWVITRTNQEYVDYLSRTASVSPLFAQVLINRGLKTPGQLDAFLNPDSGKMTDPFELPGLRAAVERIETAGKLGERVLVCGDYDADGVTATAIMAEGLREFGIDVHYFIPNRIVHGYGLGPAGIEKAKAIGAKLVITVDCGITSFEAAGTAKSLGIDVIITDHHEPLRDRSTLHVARNELKDQGSSLSSCVLPDAVAVVNPKITASASSASTLSGAGVAFKIIQALLRDRPGDADKFLDLAAIGTAADVVPAIDDNRIIIREGIKFIQAGRRAGIRALKDAAGIRSDLFKTSHLYYAIIPRINAAGRIADATDVVRLLTTASENEAADLAAWLNGLNATRQEIEESVYREALGMLESTDSGRGAIVLASEGWHLGVVGIVASKLAEKYYRPAIVLTIENGAAKGSGRSIPPFDMYAGLTMCRDVLTRFGGHKQAAGLSLPVEQVGRFRTMLSEIVSGSLSEEDLVPVLQIDAAVKISDITIELINEFARLEPFGCGNSEPLLGAKNLEVLQPRIVGSNHLKMHLRQGGRRVDSIGFDFGRMFGTLEDNVLIDAAFLPMINEWDGGRYVQLNLKAIRPSQT